MRAGGHSEKLDTTAGTPQRGHHSGSGEAGCSGGPRALVGRESLENVPAYGQNPGGSERVSTERRAGGARSRRRHRRGTRGTSTTKGQPHGQWTGRPRPRKEAP